VVTVQHHSLLQGQALSHCVASIKIALRLLWQLKQGWSKGFHEIKCFLLFRGKLGCIFHWVIGKSMME